MPSRECWEVMLLVAALAAVLLSAVPRILTLDDVLDGPSAPPRSRTAPRSAAPRGVGAGKTVVLLVDALRPDMFLSPSAFPKAHRLLSRGNNSCSRVFVPVATTPTVTLPKLKTILTGKGSRFSDVVLNFASPALLEENVLTTAANAGLRIAMYGDDTWTKLFPAPASGDASGAGQTPGVFVRSESVFSFDVSDSVEVDRNVSRNVEREISGEAASQSTLDANVGGSAFLGDLDVLVLHYLGLDHIGHTEGPRGPSMAAKQREMDAAVARVFEAMPPAVTTLLVLSDHGMAAGGGHGGASAEEVRTVAALLSNSEACESDATNGDGDGAAMAWATETAEADFVSFRDLAAGDADEGAELLNPPLLLQSDVNAILAFLLDVAAPRESLGIVPAALRMWPVPNADKGRRWDAAFAGARERLCRLAASRGVSVDDGSTAVCARTHSIALDDEATTGNREPPPTEAEYRALRRLQRSVAAANAVATPIAVLSSHWSSGGTVAVLFGVVLLVAFPTKDALGDDNSVSIRPVFAVAVLHAATFASSSFAEEEHLLCSFVFASAVAVCVALPLLMSTASRRSGNAGGSASVLTLLAAIVFRLALFSRPSGDKWKYRRLADGADPVPGMVVEAVSDAVQAFVTGFLRPPQTLLGAGGIACGVLLVAVVFPRPRTSPLRALLIGLLLWLFVAVVVAPRDAWVVIALPAAAAHLLSVLGDPRGVTSPRSLLLVAAVYVPDAAYFAFGRSLHLADVRFEHLTSLGVNKYFPDSWPLIVGPLLFLWHEAGRFLGIAAVGAVVGTRRGSPSGALLVARALLLHHSVKLLGAIAICCAQSTHLFYFTVFLPLLLQQGVHCCALLVGLAFWGACFAR